CIKPFSKYINDQTALALERTHKGHKVMSFNRLHSNAGSLDMDNSISLSEPQLDNLLASSDDIFKAQKSSKSGRQTGDGERSQSR
ncbi:hypothetical protein BGX29_000549, partial [Mortierella sp. GBA35]